MNVVRVPRTVFYVCTASFWLLTVASLPIRSQPAQGNDTDVVFMLELTVREGSNGKYADQVGQTKREIYRRDHTYVGDERGRYIVQSAGNQAVLHQFVTVAPDDEVEITSNLTFTTATSGTGKRFLSDKRIGQGFLDFNFIFIAKAAAQAKSPSGSARSPAELSDADATAKAIAALPLSPEQHNRLWSIDRSKHYWAVVAYREMRVRPASPGAGPGPTKRVPAEVEAVPGDVFYYAAVKDAVATLQHSAQSSWSRAASDAVVRLSESARDGAWLEAKANPPILRGEDAWVALNAVRGIIRTSGEVLGLTEEQRNVERLRLRRFLPDPDPYFRMLTPTELADLEAKLARATEKGEPTQALTLESEAVPRLDISVLPRPRVRIPGLDLELIAVPAGRFTMGSYDRYTSELNTAQHPVYITRPFWLGATEVTVAQYNVIGEQAPNPAASASDAPATGITWSAAARWCAALTEREKAAGRLPEGYVYGLPTEAQWEYACTCGNDEGNPGAVGAATGQGGPARVASASPNRWGFYDLKGNVWEWCEDYFGSFQLSAKIVEDPLNSKIDVSRVVRGGSFAVPENKLTTTLRYPKNETDSDRQTGFRVCLRPIVAVDGPVSGRARPALDARTIQQTKQLFQGKKWYPSNFSYMIFRSDGTFEERVAHLPLGATRVRAAGRWEVVDMNEVSVTIGDLVEEFRVSGLPAVVTCTRAYNSARELPPSAITWSQAPDNAFPDE